jgi:hypothetical protein
MPTPADPGAHIRMDRLVTDTTTREAVDTAKTTETRAWATARVRSIARIAGLGQPWIDGQIGANADPDTARRAAFEALATRSAPTIGTEQVLVEMGESQNAPARRSRKLADRGQLTEGRNALMATRYRGIRTVECDGMRGFE